MDAPELLDAFETSPFGLSSSEAAVRQEYSAERTAEAWAAMVPTVAHVIRDGETIDVPTTGLVPGDMLVLGAGDAVPADSRLVEAHQLAVDNSSLTGESRPVPRTGEPGPPSPLLDARNLVFMGTSVVRGSARAVVFATGPTTEFGRIYSLAAATTPTRSPVQREVAIMARRVGVVAIVFGLGVFGLRAFTNSSELVESFVFALGVMVALVPEGLPAALSVSLAVGVRRMARHQGLLKKLVDAETLGSTTVICSDKTGTLTKAEMTVKVVWESGRSHTVTGTGYEPVGDVQDCDTAAEALRIGAKCSDARVVAPADTGGRWLIAGDTTEGAIVVAATKADNELIFSRVKPEQKLRLVSLLKDAGEIVAVTGDGVNDAPALRLADILSCVGSAAGPGDRPRFGRAASVGLGCRGARARADGPAAAAAHGAPLFCWRRSTSPLPRDDSVGRRDVRVLLEDPLRTSRFPDLRSPPACSAYASSARSAMCPHSSRCSTPRP